MRSQSQVRRHVDDIRQGQGCSGTRPGLQAGSPLPARVGDQFAPDSRAARAYQEINKMYATLTTFTDPLFRSMADGLQGLVSLRDSALIR